MPDWHDAAARGLRVLGRGDGWLSVAKPAGLPVFPPHADPGGDCVLSRLLAAFPAQRRDDWPEGFAGGLVHRLDNPTSGQLLVAADPPSLAALRRRFSEGGLRKTYRLVSARAVPWDQHEVSLEIGHDRRRSARMVVRRGQDTPHRGRWLPASTALRRVGAGGGLGLWEAVITTGVMHQIRVHAAFVGLALAGDRLYGGGAPLDAAVVPGLPDGVPFLLHHVGLQGEDLAPPPCALPGFWPVR